MLEVISIAAVVLIAWIFVNTAIHKLADPRYIAGVIRKQLPFIGETFAQVTGVTLGIVEAVIAVAILVPATRYPAASAATGLLGIYALMMTVQLLRGRADLDCGCSGPAARQKISRKLVVRNLVLMGISGLVMYQAGAAGGAGLSSQNLWYLVIPLALLSVLVYACSEQLISNRQKLSSLEGGR